MAGNDITKATATYGGFLTIVKFGSIATAVIAAVVVMLIAS